MNALNALTDYHNLVLKVNIDKKLPKQQIDKINRDFGKTLDFILEETSIKRINQLVVEEYKRTRNEKI